MQFVYHPKAGEKQLSVDVRAYEHLFKVRRVAKDALVYWRNLEDSLLYAYTIRDIGKKEAWLELVSFSELPCVALKNIHIGWCVVDPKIVEKTLPMLNELGVHKMNFVYGEFSQKNHTLDFERMKRILINSSQQCGRSHLMEIELFSSLQSYLIQYPHSYVLDFSQNVLEKTEAISSMIVGPEGGFSEKERALLKNQPIVGLTCKTILRSETAVVAVASKILA
ncbi:16S rRNA (uracil(1498)-N(3))-methyltransferase [Sulfurospirillum barnesii]|uniref:Ribosomal RNA small subunit methyltransferase E n=1 Tax=Sulfurospirillum barnesii (strain ATCC 700032 / DSM 10660 / SES-3) TaxID=760154 RepID=I3XU83_SULBS|nr:16S rRNA (uracil(1498)-N(3))-methyltransferase [Sulfurospirillum barnesii]AFL67507.1 RNA methyltransferase, RsmE family [Sulfurospirillum barnesii SES-3]